MQIYIYYIIMAIAAVIIALLALTQKKKLKSHSGFASRLLKITALSFAFTYVVGMFLDVTAIEKTEKLIYYSPFGSDAMTTLFSLILLWLTASCTLFCAMYPFYSIELVRQIIKFICTPVFALNIVFFYINRIALAVNPMTLVSGIRLTSIALAYVLGFSICIYTWITSPQIKLGARRYAIMYGWFIASLAVSFQAYLPIALVGEAKTSVKIIDMSQPHRIVIYIGILLTVAIFLLLRRRTPEVRHFALVFISLATLFTFSLDYTIFGRYVAAGSNWALSLPLHICNTAMYLIPLCLIFKMKRLYYFTFFINVIGAFFAMMTPNYAEGLNFFDVGLIIFWVNHFCACFMPIVQIMLGEFKKPKLKQFWYSTIAFACYFVLVLVLNAWFTNYGSSDFFFINSDFIADKLGDWAKNLRNITVGFNIGNLKFVFYPVYQVLFFICYIAFTFCMWFLYDQAFAVAELYTDMGRRTEKIKLDRLALLASLDGRSAEEPVNMDTQHDLILTNVTKRYGTSSVYAVKDANLEVHGGEIFGFLGPNGAGKSTIIKSIVGIQPITSGKINICGYDAQTQPVQAKRELGFVPDHYELYENLTGREYINYIADLYRVSKADRDERIKMYISLFQLEGSFDNPMKTYSHGMKQKIAIMAALVHNPKILILDEPLTGLDPDSIFQVKECMKLHARNGNIVFFSSHIIDVVERICDRIAIIRHGTIMCCHTIAEIEAKKISLEEFYMNTIKSGEDEAVKVQDEVKKI